MHALAFLTVSVLSLPAVNPHVYSVSDGGCCNTPTCSATVNPHCASGSDVIGACCHGGGCDSCGAGGCGIGGCGGCGGCGLLGGCGLCGGCGPLCQRKAILCPPGHLGMHFPYEQEPKTYYYFRPYNYRHIATQIDDAQTWGADRKLPYSNAMFQEVYADLGMQWKEPEPVEDEVSPEEEKSESDNKKDGKKKEAGDKDNDDAKEETKDVRRRQMPNLRAARVSRTVR